MRDTARVRLARRVVSIPLLLAALTLSLAVFPALLVLALGVDAFRAGSDRGLATVRVLLFGVSFLASEVAGLSLLLGVWTWTLGRPAARERLTFPVQRLYTAMLFHAVRVLFALKFQVEGQSLATPGPVLVLVRHASIVDTLVPGIFIANAFQLRLRYVLKWELLADPCLDVAGHWIPNHFVARDGQDSGTEIAAIRALKDGLGAQDGVVLYPEGTRFTLARRERALVKLAGDPEGLARAQRLRHLLPLKPGGVLALLDAAPPCDVLFVGHHGLEGFARIADIWRGALVGRTVRVRFWREAAASIPGTEPERLAWLQQQWERLDGWLAEQEAA